MSRQWSVREGGGGSGGEIGLRTRRKTVCAVFFSFSFHFESVQVRGVYCIYNEVVQTAISLASVVLLLFLVFGSNFILRTRVKL